MSDLISNLKNKGDLRSIGDSDFIARSIQNQAQFDNVFRCLYNPDRLVKMRAADVIEKVTRQHPQYLSKHKKEILDMCQIVVHIELQWHLAQILPRLTLQKDSAKLAWDILWEWASDKSASKIVRVNSLQGLYEMRKPNRRYTLELKMLVAGMLEENIPSIDARIRKLEQMNRAIY